ncbi:MAG TPA: CBS domain-containing protein [Polyangiaceae bacterium]|nr:CBS domain-containing protein [Polyangiaceae bacterium]
MPNAMTPVAEFMSRSIIGVEESTRVEAALSLAAHNGVHHFPVLRQGQLLGLVCTCELDEAPLNGVVADRMRTRLVTVAPDATAERAVQLMKEHGVGTVLVVESGAVRGVVTRDDLVRACGEDETFQGECRCAGCGSRQHLRAAAGGQELCADCTDRASGEDWLELGVAG